MSKFSAKEVLIMNALSTSNALYIGSKSSKADKYEVNIDECMPGMKIAETINNKFGVTIISEHTLIEPTMLKLLKRLGIYKIKVFDQQLPNSEDSSQVFKKKYMGNLIIIKGLLYDLYSNKPLDGFKVNAIANSLCEKAIEPDDLIRNLTYAYNFDDYLYTHSLNVSIISMLIAKWMNYSENDIKMIVKAGLLHDIGKTKVQHSILNKPGPLSPKEFNHMQLHVNYGYEILRGIENFNSDICKAVLMHHEREDGSGYSSGLQYQEIREFAKILAVADVFDAMSSNKVYGKKRPPIDIFNQMETNSIGSLSKKITMVFLDHTPNFYIGARFFVNTGETAEIIFINPRHIARPLIKIGERYIDMSKESRYELLNII